MLDGADRAGVLRNRARAWGGRRGAAAPPLLGAVRAARPYPDQQGALQRTAALDAQRRVTVGVGGADVATDAPPNLRPPPARGGPPPPTPGPGPPRPPPGRGQPPRRRLPRVCGAPPPGARANPPRAAGA